MHAKSKIWLPDPKQRDTEKEYNIPKSTIKNKLSGKHPKTVGRPPVLSFDEERLILTRCVIMDFLLCPKMSDITLNAILTPKTEKQNSLKTIYQELNTCFTF